METLCIAPPLPALRPGVGSRNVSYGLFATWHVIQLFRRPLRNERLLVAFDFLTIALSQNNFHFCSLLHALSRHSRIFLVGVVACHLF